MTNLEKEAWDYSDSQRTAYDDDRATAYAKGYIAGATRQATKPRLRDWARELHGSRKMLIRLAETRSVDLAPHIKTKDGKKVYHDALLQWLKADIRHIDAFINGEDIGFCNHQRDTHGRLIAVQIVYPVKS